MMIRGVIPYLINPSDRSKNTQVICKEIYEWCIKQGFIQKG